MVSIANDTMTTELTASGKQRLTREESVIFAGLESTLFASHLEDSQQ